MMNVVLQRADIVKFTKQLRLSLYGCIEGMTKEKNDKTNSGCQNGRKNVDRGEDK
jgi:hypothetical protein